MSDRGDGVFVGHVLIKGDGLESSDVKVLSLVMLFVTKSMTKTSD